MKKKKLDLIADEWLKRNGASKIDFKNKELIIFDGGLFGGKVKLKRVRRKKIWLEPLPDGGFELKSKVLKGYKNEYSYEGSIWFEDINELINYFVRLKKLLNKHGFKTSLRPQKKDY